MDTSQVVLIKRHYRALLIVLGNKGSDQSSLIKELRKNEVKSSARVRTNSSPVVPLEEGKGMLTYEWKRFSEKLNEEISFKIFEVEEQREIVPVSKLNTVNLSECCHITLGILNDTKKGFLAYRGVFLIVLNMEEILMNGVTHAEETIIFWTKYIHATASRDKNPPQVIVVATHPEKMPADYMGFWKRYAEQNIQRYLLELSGNVPTIRQFFYIDLSKPEHISQLADSIVAAAETLPDMPRLLPPFFDDIEKNLMDIPKTLKIPFIKVSELEKLAANWKIVGDIKEYFKRALPAFHQFGLIYYREDLDTVILDVQWFAKLCISLLGCEIFKSKEGIAKSIFCDSTERPKLLANLKDIFDLEKDQYVDSIRDQFGTISDLLEAFSICLKFYCPSSEISCGHLTCSSSFSHMLIPTFLNKKMDNPGIQNYWDQAENWEEFKEINLYYQLNYIPKGFFAAFICKIDVDTKLKHFWKHGVILAKDSHFSLIHSISNSCIAITVRSKDISWLDPLKTQDGESLPHMILRCLDDAVEDVHYYWRNLTVGVVLMNCGTCIKKKRKPERLRYLRRDPENNHFKKINLDDQPSCSKDFGTYVGIQDPQPIQWDYTYTEHHYPFGIYDISIPMERFRTPAVPDVDIIFVHGLDGSAVSSWTNQNDQFWGLDFLARDLRESGYSCRILSIDYDNAAFGWGGKAMTLHDRTQEILQLLKQSKVGSRPVIFIVHSMGGLLTKNILVVDDNSESRTIVENTSAVIFYATPHRGSLLADATDGLLGDFMRKNPPLYDLATKNEELNKLQEAFCILVGGSSIKTLCYVETMKVKNALQVVAQSSAEIYNKKWNTNISVAKDHLNICKPNSDKDLCYTSTRDFIMGILKDKSTPNNDPFPEKSEAFLPIKPKNLESQNKMVLGFSSWVNKMLRKAVDWAFAESQKTLMTFASSLLFGWISYKIGKKFPWKEKFAQFTEVIGSTA